MERIGQLGAVGLAQESSWGVPVSAARYLEVSRADIGRAISYEIPDPIRGTRGRRQVRGGANAYAGFINFDGSAEGLGEFLKATFGTVTTTMVSSTASGSVYEHTFRRLDAVSLPSLTIEQNMGGLTSRQFAGVRVNRLSLSLAPGEVLMAEADCRGQSEQLISPTSPSYPLDEALHHNGFTALVGAADCPEMEGWEVSFGNNLVDDIWTAGGGGDIAKLPAGPFAVSGRFALGLESTTAYETFTAGDYTSLQLKMTGGTIVSTWSYLLQMDFPRVRYFSADSPLVPERLTYEIDFEALIDASQDPPVEAVVLLRNSVSGY
ncbi:MAG: hypothetical protein GTO55_11310 [Armatimonadetes bacterium]|nr:hypothetical protein [Armatimonadota bacterium]NIM24804.1 hypothetical protein [Armatimonadota bacterium]NIM68695.1 hypothetical protein [Armatimonadota bacterium]NIM76990.1 hypothetical protein [Armatimonadota bacterium]NIN06896.1 hypothetical protein [Armatimonadota bacterium]